MMKLDAIIARFPDLELVELTAWIEHGWIQPAIPPAPDLAPAEWTFDGLDLARVGLVYDLRRCLGVEEEMMPLVLSLLDQVYTLRATLKAMTGALEHQPQEVRAAVLAAMARLKHH